MPKFKKESESEDKKKRRKLSDKEYAFRTVIVTTVLTGIFFIFSILFNAEIITYFMNRDTLWDVIDVTIKVSIISLEFFFMSISLGNYKDITGKPVSAKEILMLIGLSLVQTIRNLWVFLFTLIVVFAITFYLYLVQEN